MTHVKYGDNYGYEWINYIGQLNENGEMQGYGRQIRMDSGEAFVSDGYFVKGKFTGYGAEINGDWYHHEGFFKNDKREG